MKSGTSLYKTNQSKENFKVHPPRGVSFLLLSTVLLQQSPTNPYLSKGYQNNQLFEHLPIKRGIGKNVYLFHTVFLCIFIHLGVKAVNTVYSRCPLLWIRRVQKHIDKSRHLFTLLEHLVSIAKS